MERACYKQTVSIVLDDIRQGQLLIETFEFFQFTIVINHL